MGFRASGVPFAAPLPHASLLRRAVLLGGAAALTGCVAPSEGGRQAGPGATGADGTAMGRKVAILLPLTGPRAALGQAIGRGAELALDASPSPELLRQDTGGTPDGAARAAAAAIAAGAGLILGPLTTEETSAVAPVAKAANVPVLAFTSDAAQGQPGIWALGITPAQQVRRLLLAVQAEGKGKVTAVLPNNLLGEALTNGLLAGAASIGLPPPRILKVSGSFANLNDVMKDAAGFASRRGAVEAEQKAARARGDADGRRDAEEIGHRPVPPPPMDALFLGFSGDQLGQVVPLLAFYDVTPQQVRVLGPGTWLRDAPRQPGLAGAWFAAPDPAARTGFEAQYKAKYKEPATDLSSFGFDAAAIARAANTANGFPIRSLIRPEGYAGANGLVALLPDGTTRRGLAVFEVDRGGSHIVQPAPGNLAASGV